MKRWGIFGIAIASILSAYALAQTPTYLQGSSSPGALAVGPGTVQTDSNGRASVASAKTYVGMGGTSIAQASTNVVWPGLTSPQGGGTESAPIPFSGTFRNLYFDAATGPAGGQTFTVTVNVGATPTLGFSTNTALTCTVSNPALTCSDTTHSVSVTAGQYFSLQVVTSATSGPTGIFAAALEFDVP